MSHITLSSSAIALYEIYEYRHAVPEYAGVLERFHKIYHPPNLSYFRKEPTYLGLILLNISSKVADVIHTFLAGVVSASEKLL